MTEVKEGFLCPVCFKDLGDASQLQIHFTDAHQAGDDKDVVLQVKGWKCFTFFPLIFN